MLSITEREIKAKMGKKVKNAENDFLTEMYSRDPPLSNTEKKTKTKTKTK